MKREITFALIIWVSIFAFLELSVRAYGLVRGARNGDTVTTSNNVSIFSPHPYAAYVGNPEHDGHSAQGYRAANDRMYTGDPDTFNIACLGGSSTYGTQVPLEDTYPHQLELALAGTPGRSVQVINAGLGGNSTPNLIALLSGRVVHLRPRIVIFYTGFNDAWNRILFPDYRDDYSHAQKSWARPRMSFWRHSRFLDLVAAKLGHPFSRDPHIHAVAWRPMGGEAAENWRRSSSASFSMNLLTLVAITRAHGAVPVLVTQATDFAHHPLLADNDLWARAMEEQADILRQVAAATGVDLIDVRAAMSDREDFFADVLHMSAAGNRRRAALIAAYLVEHGLIADAE
ncbi:MAG: SGNH/GDSL hydrolase family protein [Acidobacteria bacterium]|nr:SGNH/GDSL hydrolase family protein [Acidobacteriota bacterium]